MIDNQSLAISVVKLNYTIRVFLSGIVLFGGLIIMYVENYDFQLVLLSYWRF